MFINWKNRFADWTDNNSNSDSISITSPNETNEERNTRLKKHEKETIKAEELFESNLKSVCKKLNLSEEQEYYINQIFDDYNYIRHQAYTLYESRMRQFGTQSKARYIELREDLINNFLDTTYKELKDYLGEDFNEFKPFFNDLAKKAKRPFFFRNIDYQQIKTMATENYGSHRFNNAYISISS